MGVPAPNKLDSILEVFWQILIVSKFASQSGVKFGGSRFQ